MSYLKGMYQQCNKLTKHCYMCIVALLSITLFLNALGNAYFRSEYKSLKNESQDEQKALKNQNDELIERIKSKDIRIKELENQIPR